MVNDIFTIVIGEKGEYGKRLVDYLEAQLSDSARILLFTDVDKLLEWEGEADCGIIGELEGDPRDLDKRVTSFRQLVRLSDQETDEGFCRFQKPGRLLDLILGSRTEQGTSEVELTLLLCPCPPEPLARIGVHFLKEGGLYLGAEDLGNSEDRKAHMGDLCYFIHLREENILDRLREMVHEDQGRFFLDSPDLYFYLREIDLNDYKWFFDRLKESGSYSQVLVGAGIGFLSDPRLLENFDRLILVDSGENMRLRRFCDRISHIVSRDYYSSGLEVKRIEFENYL